MRTRFWEADKSGHLSNGAVEELQPEVSPLVDEAKAIFLPVINSDACLLLRGSMSIGLAVLPFSDMDLILFCTKEVLGARIKEWNQRHEDLSERLRGRIDLVDLQVVPLDVPGRQLDRCLLQASLQSIRLCGTLSVPLGPVLLNNSLYETMWSDVIAGSRAICVDLRRDGQIQWAGTPRGPNFWCRWVIRDVLRMLSGRISLRTGVYTSHLDSCAKLISDYAPDLAVTVRFLRSAEMFPPTNLEDSIANIEAAIRISEESGF